MTKTLKKDLEFGKQKEDENLDMIRKAFDSNLQKSSDNFYVIDFSSKDCFIELISAEPPSVTQRSKSLLVTFCNVINSFLFAGDRP